MKIKLIVKVLFLIGFLVILSSVLFAGDVRLSTYYPAPFGAYDRLKLVPRDSLPLDPNCNDKKDVGTLYYDNGAKKKVAGIFACHKDTDGRFKWISIMKIIVKNAESGPVESVSNEKVVCVKKDGAFGVCINNPSFDGTCGCL